MLPACLRANFPVTYYSGYVCKRFCSIDLNLISRDFKGLIEEAEFLVTKSNPKHQREEKVRELYHSIKKRCEIYRFRASLPLSKNTLEREEERKIRATLETSICHTMQTIHNRTLKKGVMSHKRYYEEMIDPKRGYIKWQSSLWNGNTVKPILCFRRGINTDHFILNKKVSPSDGVQRFLEGPVSANSGSIIEVIYLKAILDFLGEEKFNAFYSQRKDTLQINNILSYDPHSSLHLLIELINPRVHQETDHRELQIGDHLVIRGVPQSEIKHPTNGPGTHVLVGGFTKENQPLLTNFDSKHLKTIGEMAHDLVHAYNIPQIDEEKAISKQLNQTYIKENYTIEEALSIGCGKVINGHSCRISAATLAVLKDTSVSELRDVALNIKCKKIIDQLGKLLYEDIFKQ